MSTLTKEFSMRGPFPDYDPIRELLIFYRLNGYEIVHLEETQYDPDAHGELVALADVDAASAAPGAGERVDEAAENAGHTDGTDDATEDATATGDTTSEQGGDQHTGEDADDVDEDARQDAEGDEHPEQVGLEDGEDDEPADADDGPAEVDDEPAEADDEQVDSDNEQVDSDNEAADAEESAEAEDEHADAEDEPAGVEDEPADADEDRGDAHDDDKAEEPPDAIIQHATLRRGKKGAGWWTSNLTDLYTDLRLNYDDARIRVAYAIDVSGQHLSAAERGFWRRETNAAEAVLRGNAASQDMRLEERDRAELIRRKTFRFGITGGLTAFLVIAALIILIMII